MNHIPYDKGIKRACYLVDAFYIVYGINPNYVQWKELGGDPSFIIEHYDNKFYKFLKDNGYDEYKNTGYIYSLSHIRTKEEKYHGTDKSLSKVLHYRPGHLRRWYIHHKVDKQPFKALYSIERIQIKPKVVKKLLEEAEKRLK